MMVYQKLIFRKKNALKKKMRSNAFFFQADRKNRFRMILKVFSEIVFHHITQLKHNDLIKVRLKVSEKLTPDNVTVFRHIFDI